MGKEGKNSKKAAEKGPAPVVVDLSTLSRKDLLKRQEEEKAYLEFLESMCSACSLVLVHETTIYYAQQQSGFNYNTIQRWVEANDKESVQSAETFRVVEVGRSKVFSPVLIAAMKLKISNVDLAGRSKLQIPIPKKEARTQIAGFTASGVEGSFAHFAKSKKNQHLKEMNPNAPNSAYKEPSPQVLRKLQVEVAPREKSTNEGQTRRRAEALSDAYNFVSLAAMLLIEQSIMSGISITEMQGMSFDQLQRDPRFLENVKRRLIFNLDKSSTFVGEATQQKLVCAADSAAAVQAHSRDITYTKSGEEDARRAISYTSLISAAGDTDFHVTHITDHTFSGTEKEPRPARLEKLPDQQPLYILINGTSWCSSDADVTKMVFELAFDTMNAKRAMIMEERVAAARGPVAYGGVGKGPRSAPGAPRAAASPEASPAAPLELNESGGSEPMAVADRSATSIGSAMSVREQEQCDEEALFMESAASHAAPYRGGSQGHSTYNRVPGIVREGAVSSRSQGSSSTRAANASTTAGAATTSTTAGAAPAPAPIIPTAAPASPPAASAAPASPPAASAAPASPRSLLPIVPILLTCLLMLDGEYHQTELCMAPGGFGARCARAFINLLKLAAAGSKAQQMLDVAKCFSILKQFFASTMFTFFDKTTTARPAYMGKVDELLHKVPKVSKKLFDKYFLTLREVVTTAHSVSNNTQGFRTVGVAMPIDVRTILCQCPNIDNKFTPEQVDEIVAHTYTIAKLGFQDSVYEEESGASIPDETMERYLEPYFGDCLAQVENTKPTQDRVKNQWRAFRMNSPSATKMLLRETLEREAAQVELQAHRAQLEENKRAKAEKRNSRCGANQFCGCQARVKAVDVDDPASGWKRCGIKKFKLSFCPACQEVKLGGLGVSYMAMHKSTHI